MDGTYETVKQYDERQTFAYLNMKILIRREWSDENFIDFLCT